MGLKTRAVLIQEALELAGNTSLTLRAQQWMDMALTRLSMAASWPFLLKRANVALAIGSNSFTFGNGTNTSARVFKINKVTYTNSSGYRGELDPLVPTEQLNAWDDPAIVTAIKAGPPEEGYLSNVTDAFDWKVSFDKATDKAYTFVVAHQIIHPPITSDSTVPNFPDDRTIVQALIVEAMFHQNDPRRFGEQSVMERMVATDMVALLKTDSTDSNIGLANHSQLRNRSKNWLHD